MPVRTVPFLLPTAGLNTVTARAAQPTRASVDLYNATMFGPDGRMRPGSRAGSLPLFGTNVAGVSNTNRQILGLHQARFQDGTGASAAYILIAAATDLYQNVPPTGTSAAAIHLRASNIFLPGRRVEMATMGAYTYIIDGNVAKRLKLDDGTVTDWVASVGTVPTDYRLILACRGRIWLAQKDGNPNDWICTRQGDPLDFDTSQDDVGAADQGNSGFRGGQIGDTINALIGGKDDTIIFGCRNSIYELQGEPTYGTLLVRSTGVGILTPDSHCMGPGGEIYFVGTAGFYRLPLGGAPQPINIDKVQSAFTDLPDTGKWISCVWDPNRFGVHIFITAPIDANGAIVGTSSHLFYNARTDGFEPRAYPDDHGPIRAILSDTGQAGQRRVVLGGRKGLAMYLDDATLYDANSSGTQTANVAITSRCTIGPVRPAGPADRAKMIELSVTLGDPLAGGGIASSDFHCDVSVLAGKGPYDALTNPSGIASGSLDAAIGRQASFHQRVRGNTFYVQLSNSTLGKYWSVDEVYGRFLDAGREL